MYTYGAAGRPQLKQCRTGRRRSAGPGGGGCSGGGGGGGRRRKSGITPWSAHARSAMILGHEASVTAVCPCQPGGAKPRYPAFPTGASGGRGPSKEREGRPPSGPNGRPRLSSLASAHRAFPDGPTRRKHATLGQASSELHAAQPVVEKVDAMPGTPALGFSLFLVAIGAILKFAVSATTSGLDIQMVGLILMLVGLVGMALAMLFWVSWAPLGNRTRTTIRTVDENIDRRPPPPTSP